MLPPSHYCERARWALDYAGISYVEERWAVGLHGRQARRIARGTSLPILVAGLTVIQGSGSILDWTGLPGADQPLEARFAGRIGALVRQFIYAGTLSAAGSGVRDALFHGVPDGQARLGRLLWPITRRLMAVGMKAREGLLPELERNLEAELDSSRPGFPGGHTWWATTSDVQTSRPRASCRPLPGLPSFPFAARLGCLLG